MSTKKFTKGGRKAQRWAKRAKASLQHNRGEVVSAGFHERRISTLASQLEHGNPSTNLPERPAFREGVPDAQEAGAKVVRKGLASRGAKSGNYAVRGKIAHAAAEAMAEALRTSYRNFRGPGLSDLQAARKRGSPGAGRELVGHRGERLIEHITGKVER